MLGTTQARQRRNHILESKEDLLLAYGFDTIDHTDPGSIGEGPAMATIDAFACRAGSCVRNPEPESLNTTCEPVYNNGPCQCMLCKHVVFDPSPIDSISIALQAAGIIKA